MRPQTAFSLGLAKKLPWQASWPMRNNRTMAAVTMSVPSNFSARPSASRTSVEPAPNSARSNTSTSAGRSSDGDFSKAHSSAFRFQVVACM